MPISPLMVGDGRPWHHVFTTDSSIFPLTGILNSAITMHLEDINNNNALYICTGAWNITNVGSVGPPVVPATADFTPSPADMLSSNPLGRPGIYKAYPVVILTTGPVALDAQLIQLISEP